VAVLSERRAPRRAKDPSTVAISRFFVVRGENLIANKGHNDIHRDIIVLNGRALAIVVGKDSRLVLINTFRSVDGNCNRLCSDEVHELQRLELEILSASEGDSVEVSSISFNAWGFSSKELDVCVVLLSEVALVVDVLVGTCRPSTKASRIRLVAVDKMLD